ncbi:MAG: hypothetical protein AAF202_04730, partial [Pseudomonadota bacterium]
MREFISREFRVCLFACVASLAVSGWPALGELSAPKPVLVSSQDVVRACFTALNDLHPDEAFALYLLQDGVEPLRIYSGAERQYPEFKWL